MHSNLSLINMSNLRIRISKSHFRLLNFNGQYIVQYKNPITKFSKTKNLDKNPIIYDTILCDKPKIRSLYKLRNLILY
jgi:hypothetical protein